MPGQSQERALDQAHAALREETSLHQHSQQELAAAHEQVLRLEAMLSDSARELDALQVSLLCPAYCCHTPPLQLLLRATSACTQHSYTAEVMSQ